MKSQSQFKRKLNTVNALTKSGENVTRYGRQKGFNAESAIAKFDFETYKDYEEDHLDEFKRSRRNNEYEMTAIRGGAKEDDTPKDKEKDKDKKYPQYLL